MDEPVVPVPPDDGHWSLFERQQWSAVSRRYTPLLHTVNSACHSRLDAWLVFETFRHRFSPEPDSPVDRPMDEHISAAFDALIQLCSTSGSSNAVNAKLRRIEVAMGGPGPSKILVTNGIVSVAINPSDGIERAHLRALIQGEIQRNL
jgi:hypothetical protein